MILEKRESDEVSPGLSVGGDFHAAAAGMGGPK